MAVRQQSKHELANALRVRYKNGTRREKSRLLDEFVANHRLSPQMGRPDYCATGHPNLRGKVEADQGSTPRW